MNEPWLTVLRCPHCGQSLRRITDEELHAFNHRIADGTMFTRLGTRVQQTIADGLVTADGCWLYPIIAEIPQLVSGEAIAIAATHDSNMSIVAD